MKEQQEKYNLPEVWIWTTIGDIAILSSGGTPDRDNLSYFDGDIPWVKSGELNFNIITDTEEKITSWGLTNSSAKIISAGTLLIALYGATVGKLAFLGIDAATNQAVASIVTTKSLEKKWLYYYMINNRERLLQKRVGGAQPNISQKILSDFPIPLAPMNEQNRVVLKLEEILSSLEKSKEQLENSLNQLGFYKQSILKQAFEGKLTKEWRKNQNDLKTPQKIVNSINSYQEKQYKKKLSDFNAGKNKIKPRKPKKILISSDAKALARLKLPNEWLYIQLKDICNTVEHVSLKERKSEDAFIYLDIGGINNNKNIIENYKEYQWKDAPSRAQYIINVNDILFSTVRTYLKNIAMIEEEKFNLQIASSGFAVIRVLDNFIIPKYIFKYIVSDSFIQPLNELQSGSSYPAVRKSDVFDQFIPICSIKEQIVISEELDRQFSIIDHFENTIEKNLLNIESLKQSVLRKAFEGKLSEQDSNDEPASILLERIKAEKEVYLEREKERKNNSIKIKIMPEALKSILEILNENTEPISSKQLWLSSDKKDDIEEFYAELKKHIESGNIIELPRNGKESFLKLANKS